MNEGKKFIEALEQKAPLFVPGVKKNLAHNPEICAWLLDPLARWITAAYKDGAFKEAIQGYVKYSLHVAWAQQIYEKEGRYTSEGLPRIVAEVYQDEGYMVPYMWGVLLIYAFWPAVVRHLELYRQEFVHQLAKGARVLELASGHGVLGLLAAEYRPDIQVQGFDISPPAVAIARRLVQAAGHGGRAAFALKDALDFHQAGPRGQYQGVIAGMLAEHLQDPRELFAIIHYHLAENGLAFVNTALESAQCDHVYEFHRESEVVAMAEDAGLRVSRMVCDAQGSSGKGRFVPRALGMILKQA